MKRRTFLTGAAALAAYSQIEESSALTGPRRVLLLGKGGPPLTPAAAFLARANAVTALNATHINAYTALINGLVSDGIWSLLDVLFIFATQSSGVALLNLINSTYTATSTVATFTPDNGFNGSFAPGNVSTTFNPITATSPKYVQNSAHLAVWSLNSSGSAIPSVCIGTDANASHILPSFWDTNSYARVNDNPQSSGFSNIGASGFFVGNRDGATSREFYRNAVPLGTYGSVASQSPENTVLLAVSDASGATTANIDAAISAGGSLTPTQVSQFYSRMRTYMTVVGVP